MRQNAKNVSPMSNEGRNQYVVEHITDAVLKLMQSIRESCGPKPDQPNVVAYTTAYFSYGLYGWIEEWFKRGMQEAPKEMAELWEKAQQNEGDAIYSSMLRMASPNS